MPDRRNLRSLNLSALHVLLVHFPFRPLLRQNTPLATTWIDLPTMQVPLQYRADGHQSRPVAGREDTGGEKGSEKVER
jgi:hypothetical protein